MGAMTNSPNALAKGRSMHDKLMDDEESKSPLFFHAVSILRWVFLDGTLTVLFAAFIFASFLHKIHDDYFHPQLQLMVFQEENRRYTDNTYYHRICGEDDFTASSPEELKIQDHFSTEDCAEHMLTHGVSVYPNLLTNETATKLREWIARENYKRETWGVIENENRYSWGIDMNMHPYLQTYWQELAANEKFINGLEAIVGPDPAIIEFTAITSSYGATDQYMHADVIPSGSAVKFARSFVPSYSLFIPLQDTTYEMGSTHVCPGSHLCSEADVQCDEYGAFAVSGEDDGDFWPMGHGALLNQQTFHKGMGYTQEGGIDRVLLIATFAPRPNFRNGIETRQIGQGGSYSLLWHQWGHTFSDYLHSDKRMTEPQKTFRSLGLIKGNGWNYLSTMSMRMANEDTEMRIDNLEELLEDLGGLWFLPRSWQPRSVEDVTELSDISDYHAFAIGTLKRVEFEFRRFYFIGLGVYTLGFALLVILQRTLGIGKVSKKSKLHVARRLLFRFVALHGAIIFLAWLALGVVENSCWGKSIRSRKSYRIPVAEVNEPAPSTVPHRDDILFVPHYWSDHFASYAQVVDYAHPGNSYWRKIMKRFAAPYTALTQNMKVSFCTSLVFETMEKRRFLKQDEERFWVEVVNVKELINVCDRDLTIAFNPMLEKLSRQIVSLQSETKFGKFRETVMQKKTIPDYLQKWEQRLLDKDSRNNITTLSPLAKPGQSRKASFFGNVIYSPARVESLNTNRDSSVHFRSNALPQKSPRIEPFDGAWLQEGDRVEGWFRCNDDHEQWFPGTITAAIPYQGTYDVAYDDGDIDEDLAEVCVRRLQ